MLISLFLIEGSFGIIDVNVREATPVVLLHFLKKLQNKNNAKSVFHSGIVRIKTAYSHCVLLAYVFCAPLTIF